MGGIFMAGRRRRFDKSDRGEASRGYMDTYGRLHNTRALTLAGGKRERAFVEQKLALWDGGCPVSDNPGRPRRQQGTPPVSKPNSVQQA